MLNAPQTTEPLAPRLAGPIHTMRWSADGARLHLFGTNRTEAWSVRGRKFAGLASVQTAHDEILAGAVAPDGALIAAAGSARRTFAWRSDGAPAWFTDRQRGPILAIDISPDGEIVAEGGESPYVRLASALTGRPVNYYTGHGAPIEDLRFSPDGRWLAAASPSAPGSLVVWRADTGVVEWAPESLSDAFRVRFHADSRTITIARDRSVEVWDIEDRRMLRGFHACDELLTFDSTPCGRIGAVVTVDSRLTVFDAMDGAVIRQYNVQADRCEVAIRPGGELAAVSVADGTGYSVRLCSTLATIRKPGGRPMIVPTSEPPAREPVPQGTDEGLTPLDRAQRLVGAGQPVHAARVLNAALERDPADAASRDALLAVMIGLQRYAEARRLVEDPLWRPTDWEAWFNRGVALERTGDAVQAHEAYSHAVRLAPKAAEPRIGIGMLAFMEGDMLTATRRLRQAAARSVNAPSAWWLLGAALLRRRRLPEAVGVLEKALRLDPTMAPARLELARACLEMRDLVGARTEYLHLQRLDRRMSADIREAVLLGSMGERRWARVREATNGLIAAAAAGDLEAVNAALESGACPNLPDDARERTALMHAARSGRVEVAALLLEHGAIVDDCDAELSTPLLLAAYAGSLPVVDLLLAADAHVDDFDEIGMTPLAIAANRGHCNVVRRLLAAGASPNFRDEFGRTPLMHAATFGAVAIARALVRAGARADLRDAHGQTARDLAPRTAPRALLELLSRSGRTGGA